MNTMARVVTYKKQGFLGLRSTSVLAIRYDNKHYVALEGGITKKIHMNEIPDDATSYIFESNVLSIKKGMRFLEKTVFDRSVWSQKELLEAYIDIVKG